MEVQFISVTSDYLAAVFAIDFAPLPVPGFFSISVTFFCKQAERVTIFGNYCASLGACVWINPHNSLQRIIWLLLVVIPVITQARKSGEDPWEKWDKLEGIFRFDKLRSIPKSGPTLACPKVPVGPQL